MEASYEANEHEIDRLQAELRNMRSSDRYRTSIIQARPALELVIMNWLMVPVAYRRELFEAFAQRVVISKLNPLERQLVIQWRDGTQSETHFNRQGWRIFWSPDEVTKLRKLVEPRPTGRNTTGLPTGDMGRFASPLPLSLQKIASQSVSRRKTLSDSLQLAGYRRVQERITRNSAEWCVFFRSKRYIGLNLWLR